MGWGLALDWLKQMDVRSSKLPYVLLVPSPGQELGRRSLEGGWVSLMSRSADQRLGPWRPPRLL